MNITYSAQNKSIDLKSAASYLVDGLSEGIKQNFLGSDINMEFVMLSLRVYFIQLNKLVGSARENLKAGKHAVKEMTYSKTQDFIYPVFN
ncbi:MAG: hypothetical protein ABI203_06535 [Mucilaginibacter sp.]